MLVPPLLTGLRQTAQRLAAYGGVVAADLTDEGDRARVAPEAEGGLGGPVEILIRDLGLTVHALDGTSQAL